MEATIKNIKYDKTKRIITYTMNYKDIQLREFFDMLNITLEDCLNAFNWGEIVKYQAEHENVSLTSKTKEK